MTQDTRTSGPVVDASAADREGGRRVLGGSGLLIELLLPAALASALLLVLAGYTARWDLRTPLGLAVFALLLVALSAFLSLALDAFTRGRRRRSGQRRLLNRPGPRTRLFKLVVGGVLVPVAALVAAVKLELPGHETPIAAVSSAVRSRIAGPDAARAARLGDAVRRAQNPAAKTQGILALRAIGSAESLAELVRLLSDDPTVFASESEYRALAGALAAYGAQARPTLLQRLAAFPPAARRAAAGPLGDRFERDVVEGREPAHDGAEGRSEGARGVVAPAPAATTEASIATPRAEQAPPQGTSGLPSLLMQSLLQMDVKEDAEILAFARQTAADESWSDSIRGQALLLTAKLGGKDEREALYVHLDDPSALLQAYALRALAALETKIAADAAKS